MQENVKEVIIVIAIGYTHRVPTQVKLNNVKQTSMCDNE